MSEKHLAERLMYPLPEGWQDDPEQAAALKKIWPTVIAKNSAMIDAALTKLKSERDALMEVVSEFIYETTHLSPMEIDGAHKCTIGGALLRKARDVRNAIEAAEGK